MAAANDATVVTCTNNSDYAVICSFFEQFGDKSGLLFPSFHDLQQMLEDEEEVAYPLIELHVKLMRKLKKSVSFDRWEKAAVKFAQTYSDQDGWDIERFGYKKINLGVKLRLLKNLLEAQFDGNLKFKNEINKVNSDELRLQPLGKDIHGRRYWHLLDDDCNLRVYREDLDEETWDLVSSDKESMLKLIGLLTSSKELQENEGTSPATSEESSANGQEEYVKIEPEVQLTVDGPSESKRMKVEPIEAVPASSDMAQEGLVSEAIESPVLLVKGEGNGADCETGNPGEGNGEETCESRELKSEQNQFDDKSTIDSESSLTKHSVVSDQVIPPSNTDGQILVSDSELQTTSADRADSKETPPLIKTRNESSTTESNSATEPVTETLKCSVLDPEGKETSSSTMDVSPNRIVSESTPISESIRQLDAQVDEANLSTKVTDQGRPPPVDSTSSNPETTPSDEIVANVSEMNDETQSSENLTIQEPASENAEKGVSSAEEQITEKLAGASSHGLVTLLTSVSDAKTHENSPVKEVDPLMKNQDIAVNDSSTLNNEESSISIDKPPTSEVNFALIRTECTEQTTPIVIDNHSRTDAEIMKEVPLPVEPDVSQPNSDTEPAPIHNQELPKEETISSAPVESVTVQPALDSAVPKLTNETSVPDVSSAKSGDSVLGDQLRKTQDSLFAAGVPSLPAIDSKNQEKLKPVAESVIADSSQVDESPSEQITNPKGKNDPQTIETNPEPVGNETTDGSAQSQTRNSPVHEPQLPASDSNQHMNKSPDPLIAQSIVCVDTIHTEESLSEKTANTDVPGNIHSPPEEHSADEIRDSCDDSPSLVIVTEPSPTACVDQTSADISATPTESPELLNQTEVSPPIAVVQELDHSNSAWTPANQPVIENDSVDRQMIPTLSSGPVVEKVPVIEAPFQSSESIPNVENNLDRRQDIQTCVSVPVVEEVPATSTPLESSEPITNVDNDSAPLSDIQTSSSIPVVVPEVPVTETNLEPIKSTSNLDNDLSALKDIQTCPSDPVVANEVPILAATLESSGSSAKVDSSDDSIPVERTKPQPGSKPEQVVALIEPTCNQDVEIRAERLPVISNVTSPLDKQPETAPGTFQAQIDALDDSIEKSAAPSYVQEMPTVETAKSDPELEQTSKVEEVKNGIIPVPIEEPSISLDILQSPQTVADKLKDTVGQVGNEATKEESYPVAVESLSKSEENPTISQEKDHDNDQNTNIDKAEQTAQNQEAPEVVQSNKIDHLAPQEINESAASEPTCPSDPATTSPDKSSQLTQLTFDFDASAPVPIVFPPISKSVEAAAKRRGRKRGRTLEDPVDAAKDNDSFSKEPVVLRQSSRIAKLREKEDEERRKQEADRLQRLKEEHERREKRRAARDERMKKMEEKQQRRQLKTTAREDVIYKSDDDDDESSSSEDDSSSQKKKKKKKKNKQKLSKKKIERPWDSTDSSEKSSESDDDVLEDLQVEEENEELVFKSDHEFSPESDLDDEPVQPRKHARTARAGTVPKKRGRGKKVKIEEEVEEEEEEEAAVTEEEEEEEEEEKEANCQKCGQSDHPEWILLCDRCDYGWHANCVKPPLMVIPEGNWFCPPCDHATLLERLQERLEAYEFLLQEKEAEMERKREQEAEAQLAREEAEELAKKELEEEEAQEEDDEEEGNSGVGDLGADIEDIEDEESEEPSGDDDDEDDDAEDSQAESDENLNKRRQRKAAQQANYSFKAFDDMIKSALRDDGEEEEEETGGKGKGKGKGKDMRSDGGESDDEGKPRSPPTGRPSGIGNKRISTSDDDSDVMPQVIRKKKARKLNDLSASSNEEDDSDEDFQGSSAEATDSEDEDEEASDSGDSFVVDDDSDDDDVVHVSAKRKARAASPIIRRSTRSARKRNIRMDSSDTSEDESEFEVAPKRKRGNESWDSSGESSSDASWGRSKKRSAPKGRARPVAPPKPKPKPPPRKAPANRGRGRGGRSNRVESDDEPFRSNVSVKKIKEARPAAIQDDEDSDHTQKRTTRGRQISYKELISSGESGDEDGNTVKKMGTLFAADRNRNSSGTATARGGAASRRGRGGGLTTPTGRGNQSGGDTTPIPVSVISNRVASVLNQDDESRFSASTDTMEFSTAAAAAAAAASVYTTGDESHTSNDILPPSNIDPDLAALPIVLPSQSEETVPLIKEDLPSSIPASVISAQDLPVPRLIQHRPPPLVDVSTPTPTLPPDLQINRLINHTQSISSNSNSPARQSPGMLPQQRLVRDVSDSQTPPPSSVQLSPAAVATQPAVSLEGPPLYSHSGVIKPTRHSLPPTPPLYSGPPIVKGPPELMAAAPPPSAPPSVIRPYPTTAPSSALTSTLSGNSPGNPLSIQGLLGTGHPGSAGPAPPSAAPPSHPGSHIRPYGNTSHMIGHGPFLNHTPYGSPYGSAVPPPPAGRTSYMGTPVTPTPRPAYSPMYPSSHMPPHGLPLHSPYQHHGPPLRPTSSYQHAGFPQAFAAAAAAAASAEEERRIYRVAQASRESGADTFDPSIAGAGMLLKSSVEDPSLPATTAVPPESEFGGLVSYFSSQQEDFEES